MKYIREIFRFTHGYAMAITIAIALASVSYFIYRIGDPSVFINGEHIQIYLVIFGITFIIASGLSIKDFIDALLERGEYKDKDWHIAQKAMKLINKYLFLLLSVLILTVLNEVIADFQDKNEEFSYYQAQHQLLKDDEEYLVIPYENTNYFSNKDYYFWKNDTMFLEGGFTDKFLEVHNKMMAQEELDFTDFIELDTRNIIRIVNEDMYYVVQTLTTLGYGDMLPNRPIGKLIAWVSVLAAQFITIIGVILIIRDE